MLQTNNTVVCTQCLSPAGPLPSCSAQTALALRCSAGNRLRPALGCMHLPYLSRSGSPQRRRFGWDCVLCPSQVQVAQVFGERCHCDLSPFPSLQLSFLGVQLAPLLRRMVTVQNPKKSQLAKKPACSLVVYVSQGLLWPTSGLPALAACHRRGMVCSWLILFCPLFCARSW